MERAELRAVQDPPKDRYRAEPDAALITLKAEGTLGEGIGLLTPDSRARDCNGPMVLWRSTQ